ncbi:MAG TPA: VIT domain-containing protein [Isosphaeraceae bacterium]|jgi:Ca-activated chloride channel family protein|nr:VIT domain-containing protein [Isosphaeraceae bacterium]
MNRTIPLLTDDEAGHLAAADDDSGFGSLTTLRGPLPLKAMDVSGRIDGLLAQVVVRQTFVNTLDEPLEATYIFPLPDRAAVTGFRMEVAGRVVEGVLQERAQARREYEAAMDAGHRASIAEEERPGVFTLRVGNLMPGEEATVRLALTGPLPYSDGEVTFRFPLVVAPRYIPGAPFPGPSVGDGVAVDTDAVPDASRITPPVLLPGFPSPVRLSLTIDIHESGMPVSAIRTSLHATEIEEAHGARRIRLHPGERLNRDFVLRFRLGTGAVETAFSVHPDTAAESVEGTFALTIVPPFGPELTTRPRDIVFVLDRSGSMEGWKIVAARRALARMVDALNDRDRFLVLAFDGQIETPPGLPADGFAQASNRNRFRAVEYLAALAARGGTEMAWPLQQAVLQLAESSPERDRIVVLVTDGQVGNEDQILRSLKKQMKGIRLFALGIDKAVNEAFLRRLAELGGGACVVVESEERLDEVMDSIHRRIGTPVLRDLRIEPESLELMADSIVPERLPDLFDGTPVLVLGRVAGHAHGTVTVHATDAQGRPWSQTVAASVRENPAIAAAWARGHLRQLEDRYVIAATPSAERNHLEQRIIATSLRFGVLCRFTAYLAVDRAEVVNEGGEMHRILQPVEQPEGWEDQSSIARYASVPIPSRELRSSARRSSFQARGGQPPFASMPPEPADLGESVDSMMMEFEANPPDSNAEPPARMLCLAPRPLGEAIRASVHDAAGLHTSFWQALRGWLSGNLITTPQLIDLASCRLLALDLSNRLARSHSSTPRINDLRTLARDLDSLISGIKSISTTTDECTRLEELLAELNSLLATPKLVAQECVAFCLKAQTVLAAFAAGTSPAPTKPESREGFWK